MALARQLGADLAVDGLTGSITEADQKFAPDGLDAALATVGGEAASHALTSIHKDGRIAAPNGVTPPLRVPRGVKMLHYDGDRSQAALLRLNEIIKKKPFKVHSAQTFGLEEMREAHHMLETHPTDRLALRIQ